MRDMVSSLQVQEDHHPRLEDLTLQLRDRSRVSQRSRFLKDSAWLSHLEPRRIPKKHSLLAKRYLLSTSVVLKTRLVKTKERSLLGERAPNAMASEGLTLARQWLSSNSSCRRQRSLSSKPKTRS